MSTSPHGPQCVLPCLRSIVMRAKLATLCVSILSSAVVCSAQTAPEAATRPTGQPDYTSVYCSGFLSDPKVPDEIRVISGEQSSYKIVFARGEYIYINRGEEQGCEDRRPLRRRETRNRSGQ